jgi:hypothetical protein
MTGLTSALASMIVSSVTWDAKVGAVLGLLVGGALAWAAIARVLRAQADRPLPTAPRRLATAACLAWGLALPTAFAAAGLLWGLGRGLGHVVEGPISSTVRSTTETWISRANGLRTGVLAKYPLTKRLTDGELMAVVNASPQWISEALDRDEEAVLKKLNGVQVPPQVLAFVRAEFHAWTSEHGAGLRSVIERLRARAQGAAAERPTLQETIEAMVAPSVFEDAARAIRARVGHYARLLVFVSLGISAALAGALAFVWRRLRAPEAARG